MGTENQMMMKVSVRPELKVSSSQIADGSIEALVSADNTPFNSDRKPISPQSREHDGRDVIAEQMAPYRKEHGLPEKRRARAMGSQELQEHGRAVIAEQMGVRSMPSTPSARGAASVNTEINSNRLNGIRPHSSPRRGLESVTEDRSWEHRASVLAEIGFTAGEPVDSGHNSGGSGGGFFTPDIPRSTSKNYVDDEGWSSQRKRKPKPVRAPVVSKEAGKSSQKLPMEDNEVVHAFIDLESVEIDIANAPYIKNNINEELLRPLNLKCDNVTIYTLNNLDYRVLQSLYEGNVIVRRYEQRTALCKPCKLLRGCGQKLQLLEIEMITDIGKHCLDLQDIDQLNKQPVVIITNDGYGVGGFANLLKNQFGVRVIRTLPKGMKTIPIYKYLSPEEYSQLLTRAARLRQAAEDRRYEQAAGQASFLSPPQ